MGPENFFYQFRVYDEKIAEQNHNAISGVEFSFDYQPKTTRLLVKIPWSTLRVKPKLNQEIGFDVMVHDDDDGGEREMKLSWYSTDAMAYSNHSLLGTIQLSADSENKLLAGIGSETQNSWTGSAQKYIDNIVLFPYPVSMSRDKDGNIFMGYSDGKIGRISKEDPKTGYQVNFDISTKQIGFVGWSTLQTTNDVGLLVATHNADVGLFTYIDNKWDEIKISGNNEQGEMSYHYARQLKNGQIIVGGYNKLVIGSKADWKLYKNPQIPISVNVPIEFIYEAANGQIWIIERGNRVWRFDPSFTKWITYKNLIFQTSDKAGRQWFISDKGEVVLNDGNVWRYYDSNDGMIDSPVKIFESRNGKIFAAGSHKGVAALAYLQNGKWLAKTHSGFSWGINPNAVSEGIDGKIYMGSFVESENKAMVGGILCFEWITGDFTNDKNWSIINFPTIPAEFVYCLETTADTGFIGGISLLYKYKKGSSKLMNFQEENIYNDLTFTGDKLWVGSQANGLYVFAGDSSKKFTTTDGLPSNTIVDICPVDNENLLLLTDAGFACFDGVSFSSGLFPSEIENNKDNNEILFEAYRNSIWINALPRDWKLRALQEQSKQGYYIQTTRLQKDTLAPRTEITSGLRAIVLPGELLVSWKGVDPWEETAAERLEFSYRLNDEPWQPFARGNSAVFDKLKAGKYQLKVRARDSEFNVEKIPAHIHFEVLPPVYKRAWFIIMIVFFSGIIFFLVFLLFKNRVKHALAIEKVKSDKLREMDIARVKFFTNISHELRTPLTLILSYAEKIGKEINILPEKSIRHFELLKNNTTRLHRIVNQVLDLRKLQVGELKLEPVYDDLVMFVKRCIDAFQAEADDDNIELTYSCSEKQFFTFFDNIKLEHIIYNLVSNALKFTRQGYVKIDLQIEPTHIILQVQDSGIGIKPDDLNKIFNRFYQVDDSIKKKYQGTGIGLSLVKEIINVYKGDIKVYSKPNEGTTFTVELPILNGGKEKTSEPVINTIDASEYIENKEDAAFKATENHDRDIVLIVEDNEEIRQHLYEELSEYYEVHLAENGIKGRDMAFQLIPDLIISDVMMPKLDGNELCSIVKGDERTSHIPVIMLTVLDSEKSHIISLKAGADDHITKPFSIELLKSRVENLLLGRKQLREKLAKDVLMKPKESERISYDDILLRKCHDFINDNLSDTDFDVARLADKLNITQKQLYRKLKSLLNMTPVQYIRTLKLNRAAELMEKTDYTISQITYEVGFQDLRYFRNIFKEHFNCTPSEYLAKLKAKK